MRILHVAPTYLPALRYGGPILATHSLCRELVKRGHDVHVFTTNIDGPKASNVPTGVAVLLDGVKVKYFASTFLRRLSWAPALARALKVEISNFDLLHLHSVFLWPTWAAARLARKAHVPYIISPRGMLVQDLIVRRNRIVKSAWISAIEKSNVERAAAIHVTSELEGEELRHFNWRLPRLETISNGVDEPDAVTGGNEPSQDIKEIVDGRPIALYFGRLSWKKGLDRLLKAFALTSSGTLIIAGTDDENIAPRLRHLATKLRIADRVRFLPRTISGRDKEYLFAASRLFVLSSYSENFGNTVLEAMRRGLPVVVTPEVGAAEIVGEAGGGIVVEGNPESFGGAIIRLINDPTLARSLGEAGRRYVVERHTWPSVAAQMEVLYESLKFKN